MITICLLFKIVDGKFGAWTNWTDCSKTCGGGLQERTRECNNPPPSGGGKDCVGDRVETQACANDLCKGKKKHI